MAKRIVIVLTVCMLLLSGCITLQYPGTGGETSQEVLVVTATPLSGQAVGEQQVIYITATPDGAATAEAATLASTSIKITGLVDEGNGKTTIYWETVGDFPVGFELVWSDSNKTPTFPADPSIYISDGNKRSATIQRDVSKKYYVRICRYVNNSCDVYSDVGVITATKPTATATKTSAPASTAYYPPPPVYPTATPYSGPPYIKITSISYAGSGSATVYWQAYGSFPNGFLVLYATGTTVPTYGDYKYYKVNSGSARSYTVYGTNNTTYTFVVCRWTGTTCDLNSNAYVYKFTSATPTRTPGGAYPPPN